MPNIRECGQIFLILSFSIAFVSIIAEHMPSNSPKERLQSLSSEYQSLKSLPSHFDAQQGEWNELVDPSNSQKYKVMVELGTLLGQPGTPVAEVTENMGEPDEITANIYNPHQSPGFMPGPVVAEKPGGDQLNTVYLIYFWRGRHDFLYYTLDQTSETVVSHAWYMALE